MYHSSVSYNPTTNDFTLDLQPYEKEEMLLNMKRNQTKYQSITRPTKGSKVSDPVRAFFYGVVFDWVANILHEYSEHPVPADPKRRQTLGK